MCLPGNTWPEKWMLSQLLPNGTDSLAATFGTQSEEFTCFLEEADNVLKHDEMHSLSSNLSLDSNLVSNQITRWLAENTPSEFESVNQFIFDHLD